MGLTFDDDELKAEEFFKKVSLGWEGEALCRGIGNAADKKAEAVILDFNRDILDALGVGTFQRICHAKEGREFCNTETVTGIEVAVVLMLWFGSGAAVVACDQCDESFIKMTQSKNF